MMSWNKITSTSSAMRLWIKLIIICCTLCSCNCKVFRIAWIAPDQTSGEEINSYTSVAALKLALATVVTNPMILKGHSIEVEFFPTDCSLQTTMQASLKAKAYNPDVIIGPPCQEGMRMVAQLCAYWNLPVFSWYTPSIEFDNAQTFPTLIRMYPSLSAMGTSLLHLLRQNKWSKFVLIYDDSRPWTLYEDAVRDTMATTEVNMISSHGVNSTISDSDLVKLFKHVKTYSWIVVFACPWADLRRYMLAAEQAGMAFGNHVFIQLDHQSYSEKTLESAVLSNQRWMRGDAKDQVAKRAYQSLIHILRDPMNDDAVPTHALPRNRHGEFVRMAAGGSNIKIPGWTLPPSGQPDVYSLYLYDAVLMWSVLVEKVFTAGKNHKDGKLIADEARHFLADGASGFLSMTDNLDRIGKLFILYMEKDGTFKPSQILKFNATDGYDVINLKPIQDQIRYHGGQAEPSINHITLSPVTEATTYRPTSFSVPTSMPPTMPPTMSPTMSPISYPVSTKSTNVAFTAAPPGQSSDSLISRLLAKVQELEKSIKHHEIHAHSHIPDHTHTPHPLVARLTSTPYPFMTANASTKKPSSNNPKPSQAHVPNQPFVPAPVQPANDIYATTDLSVGVKHENVIKTNAAVTEINPVNQGAGFLHWHPHPVQDQHGHGQPGHVPVVVEGHAHVAVTNRPPPPRPPPVQTTAAPTVLTTLPHTTTSTAPPTQAPDANAAVANRYMDDAMINRLTARIVDHLTGTTTNTNYTNSQENQIVNDWLSNGIEELPPGILLAIQAAHNNRLLQQQNFRHYRHPINKQQTQNAHNNYNNQLPPDYAPVQQWRQPVYRDPLAEVLDPLLWTAPLW